MNSLSTPTRLFVEMKCELEGGKDHANCVWVSVFKLDYRFVS